MAPSVVAWKTSDQTACRGHESGRPRGVWSADDAPGRDSGRLQGISCLRFAPLRIPGCGQARVFASRIREGADPRLRDKLSAFDALRRGEVMSDDNTGVSTGFDPPLARHFTARRRITCQFLQLQVWS